MHREVGINGVARHVAQWQAVYPVAAAPAPELKRAIVIAAVPVSMDKHDHHRQSIADQLEARFGDRQFLSGMAAARALFRQ